MLVHQFHLGLDWELRQACVYRGLPPRLTEWFRAAIELDVGLKEFHVRGIMGPPQMRHAPDRPAASRVDTTTGTADSTHRLPFRCFRCNQIGHRALECPVSPPQPSVS